jgi:NADH-quinone oxidoreductase subunit H
VRLALGLELALAASLITALFLGGPSGPIPVIPDIVWFLTKSALVVLVLSWLRALFIRLRIGKMIGNSWKCLMSLAILQIVILEILFL